ncbi:LacI family DNA-binding transcriptional regulator [Maritalea mediterranea]|uniref:LacI family transcriptional regulator n=1 Tax=Maritalea mediterranea TaxID=2909667 RepID=A0ABS9E9Q3_9HYPH|nr:LacI family DNA-binding transcriptional regulator [Maritalea mediterranea]MCF4098133.1 LacI family transcriptional regulator [Maritalea mediterranea]
MNGKNPKIQDVAAVAGVSTATVSRALSNPDMVSQKTRDLVLDAVQKTGYRVNRAAKSLRKRQSDAILALLPDLGNPFFSQILSGIESVFTTSDLSLLVSDTKGIRQDSILDYFMDMRADGMIILDGAVPRALLSQLQDSPFGQRIVFACEWKPEFKFPSVRSDNFGGAIQAVEHLYALGHRKIGHISGPRNNVLTKERLRGVEAAMTNLNLLFNRDFFIDGGAFSLDAGAQAARSFMEMDDRPTAITCGSDLIAMGFISEITRRGLKVPEDISVVGFDDIEIAGSFIPSLTTIRQNRTQLGVLAASYLLDQIAGRVHPPAKQVQEIDVKLIPRQSTAQLAHA